MRLYLLVSIAIVSLEASSDAGGINRCYTADATAKRGSSFSVGFFLENADTLAGMQVPIYYRSDDIDLICDSVSFDGSRAADFTLNDYKIKPAGKTVYFVLIDTGGKLIPPGKGLIARLWFTAPKSGGSGKVELSSGPGTFMPDELVDYGYLFWLPSAQQVNCSYKAGHISIK